MVDGCPLADCCGPIDGSDRFKGSPAVGVQSTVDSTLDRITVEAPGHLTELTLGLAAVGESAARAQGASPVVCFHCGESCVDATLSKSEKVFCCQGCLVVHDLLEENGLERFYSLSEHPGVQVRTSARREQWQYLDESSLRPQLLDFTEGKISRVTFHIPAIHCLACVWLLENLFHLHSAIGQTQVDFPKRRLAVHFQHEEIALSELVALLASIGYEPQLTLGTLEKERTNPAQKRQWLQIGIAGFAFGNIMLFSLPGYLGLDSLSGPLFKALFGYLSLALALPVVLYSAADYWRSALLSVRQRVLTLDVPIALGLAALYGQSASELVSGGGGGYLDSLAGLVFFLLCGRAFQQRTQERIVFDRDYKCFFPLSVTRRSPSGEESVALSNLRVGDRLLVRNGELLPADGRLIRGHALIDYSFVTGESEPVVRQAGDYLYAGGKQSGTTIEIETVKPVSQSYLTSLWNHETFRKERHNSLDNVTNRYSRRFTCLIIAVAIGAALFWWFCGQPSRGLKAFASVLIVACPCALALAAPFAFGSAQRLLAGMQVFLKNTHVLERLARVDSIVFDKTGTLTGTGTAEVRFLPPMPKTGNSARQFEHGAGAPQALSRTSPLSESEAQWLHSLTANSIHPLSVHIHGAVRRSGTALPVSSFIETPGCGLQGLVEGHLVQLGSRTWLEVAGVTVSELALPAGSVSYLAIDGMFRGAFVLSHCLRPETERLLRQLGEHYELALLSGDNESERERFSNVFPPAAKLQFDQSPLDKLEFIRTLQKAGRTVMMVGDGLNDAGALKQSDVGVAVVERIGAFSPASDVILEASQVPCLLRIISFARNSIRIVRISFGVSALYNLVGISVAAAGILTPVICAVLMPLSSVSVVLFACWATRWAARKWELLGFSTRGSPISWRP